MSSRKHPDRLGRDLARPAELVELVVHPVARPIDGDGCEGGTERVEDDSGDSLDIVGAADPDVALGRVLASVALVLGISLVGTGCSGSAGAAGAGSTTLTLWTWSNEARTAFEGGISNAFEAANPGIQLEVLDRVGGGDSFASGLVFGILDGADLQTAVEYGAAHGALAMTTPGDTTSATKAEVLNLARGGDARVDR